MNCRKFALQLFASCVLLQPWEQLSAQFTTASLNGVVMDTSGALVPGALREGPMLARVAFHAGNVMMQRNSVTELKAA